MVGHIGIVGCSAEGAALCYRTICAEGATALGQHGHPEVSMHTPSLSDYVACLEAGDLRGVGDLILDSACKLERAGADFLICPDNTIHQAFEFVEPSSPLPWIHIADAVTDDAALRGYRKLAITGTVWLVESDVYPVKLTERGMAFMRPEPSERDEIHRIILNELVGGVFKPEAAVYFQAVANKFKLAGCDAVILGCTELPLIIDDMNSPLPMLDSTRLLARAALQRAIGAMASPC